GRNNVAWKRAADELARIRRVGDRRARVVDQDRRSAACCQAGEIARSLRRRGGVNRLDAGAALPVPLVVIEEEQFVSFQRPGKCAAELIYFVRRNRAA